MPKCEISDLLDSHDFYTIKPLWVDDFWDGNKKSKTLCFGYDFEVCPAKFLVRTCRACATNFFLF